MEVTLSKAEKEKIVEDLKKEFREMLEESLEKASSFQYVSRKQLAKMLDICEGSIANLEKDGLPYTKFGKSVKYEVGEVQKWITDRRK